MTTIEDLRDCIKTLTAVEQRHKRMSEDRDGLIADLASLGITLATELIGLREHIDNVIKELSND